MARKLRTYLTSIGFYDLAIAAPSMKAALEAWGAESNLFHQGAASETSDRKTVAASMASPGVVLRRPVGSSKAFKEESELPEQLTESITSQRVLAKKAGRTGGARKKSAEKRDDRKAAATFERERKRRNQAREKASAEKREQRRKHAVNAAKDKISAAKANYEAKASVIHEQIKKLERKLQREDEKWSKDSKRLEVLLKRARK